MILCHLLLLTYHSWNSHLMVLSLALLFASPVLPFKVGVLQDLVLILFLFLNYLLSPGRLIYSHSVNYRLHADGPQTGESTCYYWSSKNLICSRALLRLWELWWKNNKCLLCLTPGIHEIVSLTQYRHSGIVTIFFLERNVLSCGILSIDFVEPDIVR